jgi:hypothetical protein
VPEGLNHYYVGNVVIRGWDSLYFDVCAWVLVAPSTSIHLHAWLQRQNSFPIYLSIYEYLQPFLPFFYNTFLFFFCFLLPHALLLNPSSKQPQEDRFYSAADGCDG